MKPCGVKPSGAAMNKRELVEFVTLSMNGNKAPLLSKNRVLFVLDAILDEVSRALLTNGERVSYWPKVGKFRATWRQARVAGNPRQGLYQCINIPARYRLSYKQALFMRDAVN